MSIPKEFVSGVHIDQGKNEPGKIDPHNSRFLAQYYLGSKYMVPSIIVPKETVDCSDGGFPVQKIDGVTLWDLWETYPQTYSLEVDLRLVMSILHQSAEIWRNEALIIHDRGNRENFMVPNNPIPTEEIFHVDLGYVYDALTDRQFDQESYHLRKNSHFSRVIKNPKKATDMVLGTCSVILASTSAEYNRMVFMENQPSHPFIDDLKKVQKKILGLDTQNCLEGTGAFGIATEDINKILSQRHI